MSDDGSRGGPPRGAYGPGKTVLAQPAYLDEVAAGGSVPHAPSTVRDPSAHNLGAPAPFVPPPPPRARARKRGPSLFLIGAITTVVVGGGATFIAIQARATSDDAPAASGVPTSVAVTSEPSSPPTPPDDPSLAETPPMPPPRRPADPSKLRGGSGRPSASSRPGGGGPAPGPRPPPPRRAW